MNKKKNKRTKLILFWVLAIITTIYFALKEKDYI